MRRTPRATRIESSVSAGLDLAALEDFCNRARANGAADDLPVGARVSARGLIRRLWVSIPGEVFAGGYSFEPDVTHIFPLPHQDPFGGDGPE